MSILVYNDDFCSFLLVSASFSFSQNQSLPKVTTSTVMLVSHGTHRIAYLNVMKLRFVPNSEDFFVCLFVSGTGKTMVMDMFYSYVETENKKRVHFHGFMLDVHKSEYSC